MDVLTAGCFQFPLHLCPVLEMANLPGQGLADTRYGAQDGVGSPEYSRRSFKDVEEILHPPYAQAVDALECQPVCQCIGLIHGW